MSVTEHDHRKDQRRQRVSFSYSTNNHNCRLKTVNLDPHREVHEVEVQVLRLEVTERLLTRCPHQRWTVEGAPQLWKAKKQSLFCVWFTAVVPKLSLLGRSNRLLCNIITAFNQSVSGLQVKHVHHWTICPICCIYILFILFICDPYFGNLWCNVMSYECLCHA